MKTAKKRIFISGKVTGLPRMAVELKFLSAEEKLSTPGTKVFNPVRHIAPETSWEAAMEVCLSYIKHEATHIYMLDNWRDSRGAKLELKEARRLGRVILWEKMERGHPINYFALPGIKNDSAIDMTDWYSECLRICGGDKYYRLGRQKEVVIAKQIVTLLMRERGVKLNDIAKVLGLQDHTSIINAHRQGQIRLTHDDEFLMYYEHCRERLLPITLNGHLSTTNKNKKA